MGCSGICGHIYRASKMIADNRRTIDATSYRCPADMVDYFVATGAQSVRQITMHPSKAHKPLSTTPTRGKLKGGNEASTLRMDGCVEAVTMSDITKQRGSAASVVVC